MNETEMMRWPAASGPHPLNLLPREIRGEIFNKLKQSEAYKLRLVCQQWNEDIKDFYDFDINFNEDSPGLASILKLRIAKLKVKKLVQKRFRIFAVPEPEVRRLRSGKVLQGLHDVTFKYPNCLRRVEINYFCLIKPQKMPVNDLRQILQLCQKSVTHLELTLNYRMSMYQFQSPSCFQFRNLKELDLGFDCWMAGLFQNDSILYLLKNSQFPSLRFLRAEFSHLNDTSKTAIAVAFILKLLTKAKALEKIILKMSNFRYNRILDTPPEFLVQLSAPELPDLESLEAVTDLKRILFFADFQKPSTNMKLLLQLLPRQRVLQTLALHMQLECSSALLCSILLKNSETIVRVNIQNLNVNSEVPFDISVLKNCQKLDCLCLNKDFDDAEGSGPELINCHSFPASLTNLSLTGVRILSQDLLALLQSDLLLRLEELCICSCGDSGDCGINLAVLKKLGKLKTKMRKNLKLTKIEFRGFNCSGTKEEVWKIKAALRKLGTGVTGVGDASFQRWLLRDDEDSIDPSVLAAIWRRKQGWKEGHWRFN